MIRVASKMKRWVPGNWQPFHTRIGNRAHNTSHIVDSFQKQQPYMYFEHSYAIPCESLARFSTYL